MTESPGKAGEETLRIQKVLAAAGCASRRNADAMVAAGRVAINGAVAEPGARVARTDRVTLDGRRVSVRGAFTDIPRVLVYHKPIGVVCTRSDPEGRPTVFDDLPRGKRWIGVGRLDINTSGLLLLTTDGELANRLMHPRYGVPREYVVRIRGALTAEALASLRAGPDLDGQPARVESVAPLRRSDSPTADGNHAWYRIVLQEGRNREVRRLFEALGYTVSRLKRIRFGSVVLPRGLGPGRYRALEADAIAELAGTAGMAPRRAASRPGRGAAERKGAPRGRRPGRGRRA